MPMRQSVSLIPVLMAIVWPAPAAGVQLPPGASSRGLFVSPAGEPFRRTSGGPQPLRAWFEQADADRDGALTLAELQADFARYFAMLDADRDGEIEPDEVARYEHQILPEMRSGAGGGGLRPGMRMGGPSRRSGGAAGRRALMAGAAPFSLLPISHPIMDADTNFNRGVSPGEFSQAAGRRFLMLDSQRAGRLTLEQLTAGRRQAFESGQRDSPGLGPAEAESEGERPRGE
jgi:hypothetical protein